jgi:hypothetical protein
MLIKCWMYILLALLLGAWVHGNSVPSQAAAVGFNTQTFNSAFASSKFDLSGSNVSGKEWYLWNYFGNTPTNSGLTLNSPGLTIQGLLNGNGQISTAADLGSGNFVGTVFGGGAYFEATIKFDNTLVNTANGWPSFWSMAIEHLINSNGPQWSGQASNYAHFIEADFFEYDINGTVQQYGGTLHDWYGIFNSTCPSPANQFCNLASASVRPGISGINWNVNHKVGMLWVPATSGTSGTATFYLDDIQQGVSVSWSQFTNQSPPPTSQAWAFGIFDNQHVAINLGSGLNQPFTIQSVKVWQTSANNNITH